MTTKKVLILGGSGMLGHKLLQTLSRQFEVRATVRSLSSRLEEFFEPAQLMPGVSGENFDSIVQAFAKFRPDAVINCIGLVKQLPEAKDPIKGVEINSLLPHRVARLSQAVGARFIHISTDCVFDGIRGNYTEADNTSAEDLYGKSKALGEVASDGCLTIRTSIIGRQLSGNYGLVEWFLSQRNRRCPGYTHAIFSGLPTICLSEIISRVLAEHPTLSGLYHVSSAPISKFDLLKLIDSVYSLNADIVPDSSLVLNRSLDSTRFKEATGIKIPSWPDMIGRMFEDGAVYEQARERNLIKH